MPTPKQPPVRWVPDHICSMMCAGDVHVDLIWVDAGASPVDIELNWRASYGTPVVEVKRVEAQALTAPLANGVDRRTVSGRPHHAGSAVEAWGIWWRGARTEPGR